MEIKILGKQGKMCKAELKFATAFFAQYLMGPRMAKNLDIELAFIDLPGKGEGYCSPADAERSSRNFEILMKPGMARHKALKVLAHEMVHVKQYVRGELSNGSSTAKWQGKTYRLTNSLEAYLNWPWEIEAFGREQGLYVIYSLMLKQEKVEFKRGRLYIGGKLMRKQKEK